MLSIIDVCTKYNLSPVYVRRMIQHGRIPTVKVEIRKNTFKHMIDESTIEAWRGSVSNRTNRDDGRMKFILYSTPDELVEIQKLLESNGIESPIIRSNKVKEVKDDQSGN